MRRFFSHLLSLLVLVAATLACCLARAEVQATSIVDNAVVIDGDPNDEVWKSCSPVGGFVQRYPSEGIAPSQETTVCVARDTEALYFIVFAYDTQPDDIRGLLTQRDLDSPSDWVEVWIDPQNDHQTGYRFAVNARGVQVDARLSQSGTVEDVNWHAVWTSATGRDRRGYWVEMRIPFKELRYDRNANTFGLQVVRRIAREGETSVLSATPKAASRPLLHMTSLTGLYDLPAPGILALKPYALVALEQKSGKGRVFPRFGGDMRLNLASASTLQLTVLPDFGQVEQDPSQLNLTNFEVFQMERRQFFLDGKENFELPLSYRNFFNEHLYYSRRIGARPHVTFDLEDDDFARYPDATTILGAGKTLTRTDRGWNVSMLSAVTARQSAQTVRGIALAPENELVVAQNASYNVLRVRREVQDGKGFVAASGTYVHRFLDTALAEEQVENAAVGGADFDLRFSDFGLKGQALGSYLQGTQAAIEKVATSSTNNLKRPDASHLKYQGTETSLSGYGLAISGGKFDGSPWRAFWGGQMRSPGFNTNDLGFLQFADQHKWEAGIEHRFDKRTRWSRFGEIDANGWFEKTTGAEVTSFGVSANTSWNLDNNASAWLGTLRRGESLDPRLLRGGPAFLVPGASAGWWGYQTDPRKSWDVSLSGNWDVRAHRSLVRTYLQLTGNFRPTSSLNFSLAPAFETSENDLQYVDTLPDTSGADEYFLGRLNRQTYSMVVRVSWALGLGLTLRGYAMPYLSAGRYRNFYVLGDPRASKYQDRLIEAAYDGDAQFIRSEFRSTVVLRWDYLPGSSAYVAWTHQQSDDENTYTQVRVDREVGALFTSQADDVVMMKLDYYFAP